MANGWGLLPAAAERIVARSGERRWLLALSLAGLVPRVVRAFRYGPVPQGGEVQNIAMALADGRGYADPYFTGSGPSAHLLPPMPLLVSLPYRLFGALSPLSEATLELFALAEVFGTYLLLYRLFGRLGVPRAVRIGAYAVLCLVPVYFGAETLEFRYWDGALGLLLALGGVHLLLTLHGRAAAPSLGQEAALAALVAGTFFVSPPLGLGLVLGCLWLLAIRPRWPHRARAVGLAAAAFAALFGPWTVRNALVFHHFIPLRDNAALELSIANNPRAATLPAEQAFHEQIAAIHPLYDGAGNRRVRQVGEYAYMGELHRSVTAWIAAHPATFARLCLRHLRQMLFPSAWQFRLGFGQFAWERALFVAVVGAFGLAGFARGLARGPVGWRYPALLVAVAVLTYVPFQPIPRYMYLVWGLLLFAAASLAAPLARPPRA